MSRLAAMAGLALLFLWPAVAAAAELAAGTVLDAANLEGHLEDRFEGTLLSELLPERFQWQIREKGLRIKLAHRKPHPGDARLAAATERMRGRLAVDPESGLVFGWQAGVPFPDVKRGDAKAAWKVMWNLTYGRPRGDSQFFPLVAMARIHGEWGFETLSRQKILRVFMKGRLTGEDAPVLGRGRLFEKNLILVNGPDNVPGTGAPGSGAVLIRYDTGEDEFLTTYSHEAKKVVRWKGGYWMDQLGMTDFVGDDLFVFNAYPTWYADFKILAKKKVLVVANSVHPFWNPDGKTAREKFPGTDLGTPPHWNPVDEWEPREVFVIEATPPALHPYGRKILYIDAKSWIPYLGEFYAKSGAFWKASVLGYRAFSVDGDPERAIVWPTWQTIIDFRRNHATVFITDDQLRFNLAIDPAKLNLGSIKDRCASCLPVE